MADKIRLLLGAGASYELGMPLVWDITRHLRGFYNPRHLRLLNTHWTSGGGGYVDEVVASTAALLERGDMHYEHVLGYLQTEHRRLGHDRDEGNRFHGMYLRLVESVYALLGERQIRQVCPRTQCTGAELRPNGYPVSGSRCRRRSMLLRAGARSLPREPPLSLSRARRGRPRQSP